MPGIPPRLHWARCPVSHVLLRAFAGLLDQIHSARLVLATPDMALWLIWESLTFRMLKSAQRELVWNPFARRRQRDDIASDGTRRRRVAFDAGILPLCLFVLSGLVLLGGLFMLLWWVTVSVPATGLKSCSELERCVDRAADGNESSWQDDPPADRLTITR